MRNLSLLVATLLLASGCSDKTEEQPAQTQSTVQATENTVSARNPSPVEKEFMQSCESSIQAQGNGKIDRADGEKICQCSFNEISKKYSIQQIVDLDSASTDEKMEFGKFAMNAGMDCTKQFMSGAL